MDEMAAFMRCKMKNKIKQTKNVMENQIIGADVAPEAASFNAKNSRVSGQIQGKCYTKMI